VGPSDLAGHPLCQKINEGPNGGQQTAARWEYDMKDAERQRPGGQNLLEVAAVDVGPHYAFRQ
jgi:hypothetical protein